MEKLMTIEEVAGVLQLSVKTIRRYVAGREIPYHKLKMTVRFRPSEIERWIESGIITYVNDGEQEIQQSLFVREDED
jgi:excisionase family DNA binding protein